MLNWTRKALNSGKCTFIGMTGIVDENDLSGIDDVEGLLTALDEVNEASGRAL